LALIISGAVGNLIDRFVYRYVVDFIMLHYKDVYYFPTFNVADMLVVVGTFLLAICILKDEI
jgi:signal peptidase II